MRFLPAVLSLILLCHAHALDLSEHWTTEVHMVLEGPPVAADLTGDRLPEVVTAAYEHIIALKGTGEELWRFEGQGRYQTRVAVSTAETGRTLLYAGDNTGQFVCLDGSGNLVWQRTLAPVFAASPAVATLKGTLAVLQGDKAGMLHALDARTGETLWQRQLEGECASPAIGDLDGDGVAEIVISTGAGTVYALSADGDLRWEFDLGAPTPDWATASPVLFPDRAGGMRVACASGNAQVYCLDPDGQVLWAHPTQGAVASTLSAADFDGNGRADVFAVTQLGMLYRFDEDGRVQWEIDTQGRSLAPGVVADLNGDGALEYLLSTQTGGLLAFGQQGSLLGHRQFPHRTINMTPAIGDFLPEQEGLEFVVTGGEAGRLICLGVGSGDMMPEKPALETARMAPENLSADEMLAQTRLRFTAHGGKAGEQPLMAQAWCVLPGGARKAALAHIPGAEGVVELPLEAVTAGDYQVQWQLQTPAGTVLDAGAERVPVEPFARDRALVTQALNSLQTAKESAEERKAHQDILGSLDRMIRTLRGEAHALERLQGTAAVDRPEQGREIAARTATVNARATRARAFADIAQALLRREAVPPVVLFESTLWENRGVDQLLPDAVPEVLRITRKCVPGESEPVSIGLFNPSSEPVRLICQIEGTDGPLRAALLQSIPVPTNQGEIAWDPLLPLEEGVFEVPPLESRELWLDIDLRDVSPGQHRVRLVVAGTESQAVAEVALDVLPFGLAPAGAMRLCAWAQHKHEAVTQDMLAHGNNVFITHFPPPVVTDAHIGADFTALDAFIAPLRGHDIFLLFHGIPVLGVPMEDEAYVPRLRAYLETFFAHMAEQGFPENRIASYPYDEPGIHGWPHVNRYMEFARQGLRAWPSLQFYVNGSGDLAMLQVLGEVAGVWCPGYYMLSEQTPEMASIRNTGKTLWSYDCFYRYARPIGPNTKTINLVAQYRLHAMAALHFGATGIGYWSYNIGPDMWEAEEFEYPLVYTNADGSPTPSRRWKAVRESMEDARILIALKARLEDRDLAPQARETITRLLEETLAESAETALQHAHLGVARYVLDAAHNDASIQAFRNAMMDCVAAL